MLRQAGNLIVQSVLSTVINSVKPINVACKLTLESTAALQSGVLELKDKSRRVILPNHPINKLEPLTFNEALVDIHDVRASESRVLDKRTSVARHSKLVGMPTKDELFGKFREFQAPTWVPFVNATSVQS